MQILSIIVFIFIWLTGIILWFLALRKWYKIRHCLKHSQATKAHFYNFFHMVLSFGSKEKTGSYLGEFYNIEKIQDNIQTSKYFAQLRFYTSLFVQCWLIGFISVLLSQIFW